MEFEVLKRSHVKRNILIGVAAILIISAIVFNLSRAKYRVTDSVPIINSEINYKVPDLNMVSLYIANEEGEYIEADTIPESGYTLNTQQSYCGRSNNGEIIKDESIILTYENGSMTFSNVTKKGTKCYLYFDEQPITVGEQILANYPTVLTRTNFSATVTNTTTGTIYYADTSKGRTYYFAGAPTDNWVQFGGFYWRIVRVNEDGSIRLIYNGTGTSTTGTSTQIGTSAFNYTYGDNTYVGYMMGLDNQCTSGSCSGSTNTSSYSQSVSNSYDSTIKKVLDTWYQNNLQSYANQISTEAGFCGDRTYANGNAYGTNATSYGTHKRLSTNKTPSFECTNAADLYTVANSSQGNKALDYPIGLITADEVAYAGSTAMDDSSVSIGGSGNDKYYLYTGQKYWTMSPSVINAETTYNFSVDKNGLLNCRRSSSSLEYSQVNMTFGVRPVINLSPNVTITGSGTSDDPYLVVGSS